MNIKYICVLVLWMKVASTLEGLILESLSRLVFEITVPIEPSRNIWYDLRGLVRGGSGRLGGRKGEKYLFGLVGLGMLA